MIGTYIDSFFFFHILRFPHSVLRSVYDNISLNQLHFRSVLYQQIGHVDSIVPLTFAYHSPLPNNQSIPFFPRIPF